MRVCLDPGHGGIDSGAVGKTGVKESKQALILAKLIAMELAKDFGIELTRYSDERVFLPERAEIANSAEADIFLSIHFNSAVDKETGLPDPQAHGTETYHHPQGNERLAKTIHPLLLNGTQLRDRGIKTANFSVLRNTKMPAALIEICFLSNPQEEKLAGDCLFLVRVAKEISAGIRLYFK